MLHVVAAIGDVEITTRLIEEASEDNSDMADEFGGTAPTYAMTASQWDSTVQYLLDQGAKPDTKVFLDDLLTL